MLRVSRSQQPVRILFSRILSTAIGFWITCLIACALRALQVAPCALTRA
jgi:hypothetical protein